MAKKIGKKRRKPSAFELLKKRAKELEAQLAQEKARTKSVELMLQSLSDLYRRDPSVPGLCLAYLPDKGTFYGSLFRYNEPMGKGKEVICCSHKESIDEVVMELAEMWVVHSAISIALLKHLDKEYPRNDGATKDGPRGNGPL